MAGDQMLGTASILSLGYGGNGRTRVNPVSSTEVEETVRRQAAHLSPSDVAALAEIVRRLIQAYQPEKVYLFGSKARGDAGPDSDFDLMVVVPDAAPPERRRSRLAYEALRGTGTAADVQVLTRSAFESRLHLAASLPATVARDGRLLHGHDPVLVAETKAWFTKAANDLRAADHEFSAQPPLLGDIVFHCQQAVEKSMKGFLTWHNRPFRKTHSLEELGEQCLTLDPALKSFVDRSVPLSDYAWKFRYPGEPEEPDLTEAQDALVLAREVYVAILARLPEAVRA
jgi:predicted nucleotidyltransferase/HEPN domain-containing protein